MDFIITGNIVVLGNNIDTDQIYPGRYLELVSPEDLGLHCLEGVDPMIASNFKKGDIVVAGTNFGCGSSREHAPVALLSMGAGAVIADSFARIFFRNAINLGLPLIVCPGISKKLKTGDRITLDIKGGRVSVEGSGEIFVCDKIGEQAMDILDAGGIKPLMRARMEMQKNLK